MKNNPRTHKDLEIWKLSVDFVTEVYNATKVFPEEERFGLQAQICRAAVSVPANIAEGASRQTKKEFVHFFYISSGSLGELETLLIIANNLKQIEVKELLNQIVQLRKMLFGLIKSMKK